MCDTKLRERSYTGEKIGDFLREALMPATHPDVPALTVPTLQRLMGHIEESWVDPDVMERIIGLQAGEPGPTPIDQLVAPALRSGKDFTDHKEVVIRVASASTELWKIIEGVLVDEVTGQIHIVVDGLVKVLSDPRNPTLWTAQDYDLILNRTPTGRGTLDVIARIANASIRLSGFSAEPEIPKTDMTSALRQFSLTGE